LLDVTHSVTIDKEQMIRTFRHKGLKRLFETGRARGVSNDLAPRLIRQMDFLNRAASPFDMNLPGYRLHELKGQRRGTWSVTVSGNWRLTFIWTDADAYDVDLEDYH
jgi:proteic killer suppression protein